MLTVVFENIVEGDDVGADLGIALPAPFLRLGIAQQAIDCASGDMIDMPSLLVVQDFKVAGVTRRRVKAQDQGPVV